MNRNMMIVGAVVVVLLLLGVGYMVLGKNKTTTSTDNPAASQDSNEITSIKDLLTKSASMECNYTTEEGVVTKAYIKNGQVRADITGKTAPESGSVIIKDNKMYFWNSQSAFTMELTDEMIESGAGQGQSTIADLEKYKQNCNNASVADSQFALPNNVKFQDMSQVMQQLPSGAPSEKNEVPEDYQKLMEQYSNPQR